MTGVYSFSLSPFVNPLTFCIKGLCYIPVSLLISAQIKSFNPIAVKTAKSPKRFGRSECNRVKMPMGLLLC